MWEPIWLKIQGEFVLSCWLLLHGPQYWDPCSVWGRGGWEEEPVATMCVCGGGGTNLYWDPYTHHPYETKDLICKGRVAKSVTGKNPLELREEERKKIFISGRGAEIYPVPRTTAGLGTWAQGRPQHWYPGTQYLRNIDASSE